MTRISVGLEIEGNATEAKEKVRECIQALKACGCVVTNAALQVVETEDAKSLGASV